MTQRELGRFAGLVCGLWLCAGWFCASASATTITVNTTVDELNSNGNCSLREAIKSTYDGGGSFDNCPQGSSTVADVIVLQSAAAYNLSRVGEDGEVHKFRVSGEPMFNQSARFVGYRGIGVELPANV